VRDLEQVESVVRAQPGVTGYALALSHDSSCWRCSRVHTSVSPPAASTKARDSPDGWHGRPRRALERPAAETRNTCFRATHSLHWKHDSRVSDSPAGPFRYILVKAR
jgi:hypothetical protein